MILLAGAAALAGASVQAATGFGFALLLSPALFAALDPYEAITALLVLGLLLNLLVLADGGLTPVRGRLLAPLLVAALPGLALGVALLAWLPKPILQVVVGLGVLGAVAMKSRSARKRIPSALAGLSTGALTTSVGLSGPPLVLWLESRGLTPAELRASLAAAFLALNLAGGAALVASGGAGALDLTVLAPLLALVLAGHALGALVFRRLDAARFSAIAISLVAVAGVASVTAGGVALAGSG